jgi:hypothetical protein
MTFSIFFEKQATCSSGSFGHSQIEVDNKCCTGEPIGRLWSESLKCYSLKAPLDKGVHVNNLWQPSMFCHWKVPSRYADVLNYQASSQKLVKWRLVNVRRMLQLCILFSRGLRCLQFKSAPNARDRSGKLQIMKCHSTHYKKKVI